MKTSSGGRSYEQVHKSRPCHILRVKDVCWMLLGALGGGPARPLQDSRHILLGGWGELALIKVCRPPQDKPTCWSAVGQSVLSAASCCGPTTRTGVDAHTRPGSTRGLPDPLRLCSQAALPAWPADTPHGLCPLGIWLLVNLASSTDNSNLVNL